METWRYEKQILKCTSINTPVNKWSYHYKFFLALKKSIQFKTVKNLKLFIWKQLYLLRAREKISIRIARNIFLTFLFCFRKQKLWQYIHHLLAKLKQHTSVLGILWIDHHMKLLRCYSTMYIRTITIAYQAIWIIAFEKKNQEYHHKTNGTRTKCVLVQYFMISS